MSRDAERKATLALQKHLNENSIQRDVLSGLVELIPRRIGKRSALKGFPPLKLLGDSAKGLASLPPIPRTTVVESAGLDNKRSKGIDSNALSMLQTLVPMLTVGRQNKKTEGVRKRAQNIKEMKEPLPISDSLLLMENEVMIRRSTLY